MSHALYHENFNTREIIINSAPKITTKYLRSIIRWLSTNRDDINWISIFTGGEIEAEIKQDRVCSFPPHCFGGCVTTYNSTTTILFRMEEI